MSVLSVEKHPEEVKAGDFIVGKDTGFATEVLEIDKLYPLGIPVYTVLTEFGVLIYNSFDFVNILLDDLVSCKDCFYLDAFVDAMYDDDSWYIEYGAEIQW